jgi:hypothetical protein
VGDFLSSVYSYFFPDPQDIQQAKADAKRIKGELELRNHHPIILYQAFHWILKAVAPTIETLSVAVEHSFLPTTPMNPNSESTSEPKEPDITPRVYPIFPNLTELTIAHPRSWPLPSPADCPFPKDSYPSLKRVDLSGVRHYIHPVNLLFNICNLTPGVTHIHLPTFDSMHIRYFAEHLDQSLAYINNQNPVNVHGETVDRFPETVERVVIQLRPMKDIFTELLDSYLERFREVAQKDERFVFVRRKWVSVEDEPLEQEKRWLDRLEGGEGCWNSEGSIVQGI